MTDADEDEDEDVIRNFWNLFRLWEFPILIFVHRILKAGKV